MKHVTWLLAGPRVQGFDVEPMGIDVEPMGIGGYGLSGKRAGRTEGFNGDTNLPGRTQRLGGVYPPEEAILVVRFCLAIGLHAVGGRHELVKEVFEEVVNVGRSHSGLREVEVDGQRHSGSCLEPVVKLLPMWPTLNRIQEGFPP